jgi:hypothetical protein
VDVDLEGQLPFFVADLVDRLEARLVRSVIDEDVDTAELRYGLRNHGAAVIGALDIARDKNGLAARIGDQPFGVLGVFVFIEIGDQHIGSFAGVGKGDGAADAAVAAGNDRLLAVEPTAAFVGSLAMVRQRVHCPRLAGHGLRLAGKGRTRIMQHFSFSGGARPEPRRSYCS